MVVDHIKRVYTFTNPFDIYNKKEKILLVSKKDMQELLDSNKDVVALIYSPVGLGKAEFVKDLTNGVKILTFKTDSGDYVDIPEKYVTIGSETFDGVPYQSNVMAFKLGPLPTTEDLTTLMNDIKTIIDGRLGINSKASILKASSETVLDRNTHNLFTADRQSLMNDVSLYSKYINCLAEKNRLDQFIQELITYNQNNC